MNNQFDNGWEAELDRQLKDLPNLVAPADLIARTMNGLVQPAAPWHARPWHTWPAGLRAAYLVLGLISVLGVNLVWRMIRPGLFAPIAARFAHLRAGAEVLCNAVGALAGAAAVLVDHLGKGVLVSCALAVVVAYGVCIGFGTVFVRLALSGPAKD